jgi:protein-tyrosine kinase
MSHLLKALRSLETRGAAFAPQPEGLAVQDASCEQAVLSAVESLELSAESAASASAAVEPPARVKPRLAPRVSPRRTAQPPVDSLPRRPLLETLAQAARLPVAKRMDETPGGTTATAAQTLHYTLAPAVAVNQAALDAGAALARDLAVQEVAEGEWPGEDSPAAQAYSRESARPLGAPKPLHSLATPRSPTLFEHRIREALLHPARSRPFAELVQRLRHDFRGSQNRSLLFTGIGTASRGDEMLAHVAALFAEQGEKVLLVDADFEREGLTAGFGAGTLGGLQNAVAAPRTWQDHLLTTSFPNLAFLPTGRGTLGSAAAGVSLTSLIPKLEAEFPLVLIDGGQSSGSLLTPLARSCDATYFVIRLGTTDAKEAQRALKSFRAAGARVMGCVAVMAND